MEWLKRFFAPKKQEGPAAGRRKMAAQLHGLPVRYVTERRDGNDDVIGRSGHMSVYDDQLILDSGSDTLFRADVTELEISYLMSGDGVILRGKNLLENGRERTLTVHFVYHRK